MIFADSANESDKGTLYPYKLTLIREIELPGIVYKWSVPEPDKPCYPLVLRDTTGMRLSPEQRPWPPQLYLLQSYDSEKLLYKKLKKFRRGLWGASYKWNYFITGVGGCNENRDSCTCGFTLYNSDEESLFTVIEDVYYESFCGARVSNNGVVAFLALGDGVLYFYDSTGNILNEYNTNRKINGIECYISFKGPDVFTFNPSGDRFIMGVMFKNIKKGVHYFKLLFFDGVGNFIKEIDIDDYKSHRNRIVDVFFLKDYIIIKYRSEYKYTIVDIYDKDGNYIRTKEKFGIVGSVPSSNIVNVNWKYLYNFESDSLLPYYKSYSPDGNYFAVSLTDSIIILNGEQDIIAVYNIPLYVEYYSPEMRFSYNGKYLSVAVKNKLYIFSLTKK